MTTIGWLAVCCIVAIVSFLAGAELIALNKWQPVPPPKRDPEWLRVSGATPTEQQRFDRLQMLRDLVTEECNEVLAAYFGGEDSGQFSSLFAILMKHGERIERI